MKKSFSWLLVLLATTVASFSVLAQNVHSDYFDGQLWIQFDNELILPHGEDGIVNIENLDESLKKVLSSVEITSFHKPFFFSRSLSLRQVYELHFSPASEVYRLIEALASLSYIHFSEQVPIMRTSLVPNDPLYYQQYALPLINAPSAWDITTGNSQIIVAVVDDAVKTNHPDLLPALIPGWDVADNDSNPNPNTNDMNHGTHVAGIIGAATNNNSGVASIGFGVSIMPVKSSNQPTVVTHGYNGLLWAAENNAHVINMSWGGYGFSQVAQNVVDYAYNMGSVLVAAAGNDDVSMTNYPAGFANVIAVASTDMSDYKSGFSNYGNWVDVSAPGSSILSTYFDYSGTNSYTFFGGTSMASPLVAGLCGLMLSLDSALTPAEVKYCLLKSAHDIDYLNSAQAGQLGAGRVDAFSALQCVSSIHQPPSADIFASYDSICVGNTITFSAKHVGGGMVQTYQWLFPGATYLKDTTEETAFASYYNNGSYTVTLIVSNNYGSDTITHNVHVGAGGYTVVFSEDFESSSTMPSSWTINNPDSGLTWTVSNVQGHPNGKRAARVNMYNYGAKGERDYLISPTFSLEDVENVRLSFSHAHRRRNSFTRDSLIVHISVDSGQTWERLMAAGENGSGNFATNTAISSAFLPKAQSDWCFGASTVGVTCFDLNLSMYEGQPKVMLMFEAYNDNGNNLYIDDIVVYGHCTQALMITPQANFSANRVDICEGETVQFSNLSYYNPDSIVWIFDGGNSINSTVINSPSVTYDNPGSYDVTLIAMNTAGIDTLTINNYINVHPKPSNVKLSNDSLTIFTDTVSSGSVYQWYFNNQPIEGATQASHEAEKTGNYFVVITTRYGCTDTSSTLFLDIKSVSVRLLKELKWEVYPNPTKEGFSLQIEKESVAGRIEIYDMIGRKVIQDVEFDAGKQKIWVSTENLSPSIYVVKIKPYHADIAPFQTKIVVGR